MDDITGNFLLATMLIKAIGGFLVILKSALLTGVFSMCFFSGIGFWIYSIGFTDYNWSAYVIGSTCLSVGIAGGTEIKYPNFWDLKSSSEEDGKGREKGSTWNKEIPVSLLG